MATVLALCLPDDVRRMLRKSSAALPDEAIQPFIDAASLFVVNFCRQDFATAGPQSESFYDVRQDDIIFTRDRNATGIALVAVFDPGSDAEALVLDTDYQLQNDGRIQMLYQQFTFPQGLEGAVVSIRPKQYSRVTVSYTGVAAIPETVRDGTALIAASAYTQAPRIAAGLSSEHIADYTYAMPAIRMDQIPPLARQYLRQYLPKHKVRSA